MPKLYPDLFMPRLIYVAADLAVLSWIAAWVLIGDVVYNAVMTLDVIGRGVIATGQKVNDAITQIQQAVAGLPLGVGPALRDAINPVHTIPSTMLATGYDELQVIQHLALLLSAVVAVAPVLAAVATFIPWRIRASREFRSLDKLLRRPGANSVSTTMQVLAARALYTLPYHRLLQFSADPIREWREGRFYNLARAAMAVEGLDVRRYLRRMEGLAPLPLEHDLPTIGDEQ